MSIRERAKVVSELEHRGGHQVADQRLEKGVKAQAGTVLCDRCGAVGIHKRWIIDRKLSDHFAGNPLVRFIICPGCRRVEDKVYEGEVTLDSPLLAKNKEMVYATLYHTAAKGFLHNPLSRVAIIEDQGDKIRIVTTTCALAERLGKAIYRAFKGKIEIKPSPDEQFVFVRWYRHD